MPRSFATKLFIRDFFVRCSPLDLVSSVLSALHVLCFKMALHCARGLRCIQSNQTVPLQDRRKGGPAQTKQTQTKQGRTKAPTRPFFISDEDEEEKNHAAVDRERGRTEHACNAFAPLRSSTQGRSGRSASAPFDSSTLLLFPSVFPCLFMGIVTEHSHDRQRRESIEAAERLQKLREKELEVKQLELEVMRGSQKLQEQKDVIMIHSSDDEQ